MCIKQVPQVILMHTERKNHDSDDGSMATVWSLLQMQAAYFIPDHCYIIGRQSSRIMLAAQQEIVSVV